MTKDHLHPRLIQARNAAKEIENNPNSMHDLGAQVADRKVTEITQLLKSNNPEAQLRGRLLIARYRQDWIHTSGSPKASGTAGAILSRLQASGIIDELIPRDETKATILEAMKKTYELLVNQSPNLSPQEATYGKCSVATELVIKSLADRPDVCQSLIILSYYDSSNEPATYANTTLNAHEVFLAQGLDGTFFAGSPANYQPARPHPANQLYEAQTVTELLSSIAEGEGGVWPPAEIVANTLADNSRKFPRKGEGLEVASIVRTLNTQIDMDRTTVQHFQLKR